MSDTTGIRITDPRLVDRIRGLIHETTDHGRPAIVIDPGLLERLLTTPTQTPPIEDDEDDEDGEAFEEEADAGLPDLLAHVDWTDVTEVLDRQITMGRLMTRSLFDLIQATAIPGSANQDPVMSQTVTARAFLDAALTASNAYATIFLACNHYHMRNFHGVTAMRDWEQYAALLIADPDDETWANVLTIYPDIPRVEEAFARLNHTHEPQTIPLRNTGLMIRLNPTGEDGGFQPELIDGEDMGR